MTLGAPQSGSQRAALSNRFLIRHVLTHLLAVIGEWGIFIGVLVYAFDQGGSRATGIASIAMILPYLVVSPVTGALAERFRPQRVRVSGLIVQALGGLGAALAAAATAHVAIVIAGAVISMAAITTLRPSGAVLAPALVRSSGELTIANLWTGYSEVSASLLGPLAATGLLAVGGPTWAIAGCSVSVALGATLTIIPPWIDPPGGSTGTDRIGPVRLLARNLREIRSRPGVPGVITVAGAQYFAVGALDIILVVAAEGPLEMGESGAGVLLTMFGVGALVSAGIVTLVVRRSRLAPVLTLGMIVLAVAALVFGLWLTLVTALVLLPIMGAARAMVDSLADVLLHRSAAPEVLASIYAVIEISSGAGLILGSLAAQTLIAVSGIRGAIIGISAFFVVVAIATRPAMRIADETANVPVVSMSLLRRLPIFATLPRTALETVSRSARELETAAGDTVILQGDHGDEYYAIAEGAYDVSVNGIRIAQLTRGDGFGEVALLADIPRTATVTATARGRLVALERADFLLAVTGHDSSRQAAWGVIHAHGSASTPDVIKRGTDEPVTEIDGR
jgi:MFS family permease